MKKSVKTFGAFATSAAAKNLKSSAASGLYCHAETENNISTIYLLDGYYCLILKKQEYEAIARPVTNRDPGEWVIEKTEARPTDRKALVEKAIVKPALEARYTFTVAPFTFEDTVTGNPIAALYSAEADIAIICNANYLASFAPGSVFKSAGNLNPIFAFDGDRLTGLVMPIRPRPTIERAVRAYFNRDTMTEKLEDLNNNRDNDIANRVRHYLTGKITLEEMTGLIKEDATAELTTVNENLTETVRQLSARIAELEAAAVAPAPIADAAPIEEVPETPDPLADIPAVFHPIAAAALAIDGIEITVKGAKTEKPILWISCDTYENRDALKAIGLKYSNKRRAWYIAAADVKAVAVVA